jgi:hypothetical protein
LGIPSTNAFIGPRLLAKEPKLLEYLAGWEKNVFKLAMGFPKWMTKEAHVARENIINAFLKRGADDEAMIYVKKRTEMCTALGLDQRNLASANFSLWTA